MGGGAGVARSKSTFDADQIEVFRKISPAKEIKPVVESTIREKERIVSQQIYIIDKTKYKTTQV